MLSVFTLAAMRTVPTDLAGLSEGGVRPKLVDRYGQPLTITFQNHWNVHDRLPLHEIPAVLQGAFILAEDKRFYQHSGIDWLARFNAVLQNVIALEGIRGASTISEQVVRMLHVRKRSIWARWLEGWEARKLEQQVDKASILEFYLNQVPYAAQRRGVQQAARYYFDRDLNTLSEKEMMSLAVLVRAPSRFDLHKSTNRIQGRLNLLIDRAAKNKLIANAQDIKSAELQLRRANDLPEASHFARHVYQGLGSAQMTTTTAKPVVIETTLDSRLQTYANELLNDQLKRFANKNVRNAGMLVVDHINNEVLAWSVGENGQAVDTEYDTILSKRQPGSTLKPFVYAAALRKGWNASTMIEDRPLSEGVGRGVHQYRNYSNKHYGAVSVRNALGNSLNIPAIKAAKYVGLPSLLNTLNGLGLNELDLRSVDYGNGIALGNGESSLYSMARAYAVLARNGFYQDFNLIKNASLAAPKPVFSAELTSLIANILSDDDARSLEFGRGGNLHFPVQTAIKTGTSNDYRDAWIFGFNHRYLVGVWMGNLNNEPMLGITGSKGPALIMRSMFAELNKHGPTQPLYLSPRLSEQEVCIDDGALSDGRCATRSEYFLPDAANTLKQAEKSRFEKLGEVTATPGMSRGYQLLSPINQTQMAYDPRIPSALQLAEFKLNQNDGVERAEWFINESLVAVNQGEPHLWPIARGEYTLTVRVFSESGNPPTTLSAAYLVK